MVLGVILIKIKLKLKLMLFFSQVIKRTPCKCVVVYHPDPALFLYPYPLSHCPL